MDMEVCMKKNLLAGIAIMALTACELVPTDNASLKKSAAATGSFLRDDVVTYCLKTEDFPGLHCTGQLEPIAGHSGIRFQYCTTGSESGDQAVLDSIGEQVEATIGRYDDPENATDDSSGSERVHVDVFQFTNYEFGYDGRTPEDMSEIDSVPGVLKTTTNSHSGTKQRSEYMGIALFVLDGERVTLTNECNE
jgi:hypothetical protein